MFRRPYLRGNPGKLSPEKQREYGLILLKLRARFLNKTGRAPRELSYQAIANKVGVCAIFPYQHVASTFLF